MKVTSQDYCKDERKSFFKVFIEFVIILLLLYVVVVVVVVLIRSRTETYLLH